MDDKQFKELKDLLKFHVAIPEVFVFLSYPSTGSRRAMPPGVTTFDFLTGIVTRPDGREEMSNSIKAYGLSEVRSGFIWLDSDVAVEAILRGKTSGKFFADQCNSITLQFLPMDQLRMDSSLPYEMYAFFSSLNFAPQLIQGIVGHQERYAEISTSNTFTNVLFGPTLGGELASAYRRANVHTAHIGVKVFFVINTGANDGDINLQLLNIHDKTWVDAASTGASTTIASGASLRVEEALYCHLFRLRARSTTAGSPTTFEVQYNGFTGIR